MDDFSNLAVVLGRRRSPLSPTHQLWFKAHGTGAIPWLPWPQMVMPDTASTQEVLIISGAEVPLVLTDPHIIFAFVILPQIIEVEQVSMWVFYIAVGRKKNATAWDAPESPGKKCTCGCAGRVGNVLSLGKTFTCGCTG